MDAFGKGDYIIINEYNIKANFCGRIHFIKFEQNYTFFSSVRENDLLNVVGRIIYQ